AGRSFVQDCYRWLAVREVAAIGELTGLAVRGLKVVSQMAFVGDDRDRVRIAAGVEVLPGHCRAGGDADHLGCEAEGGDGVPVDVKDLCSLRDHRNSARSRRPTRSEWNGYGETQADRRDDCCEAV